LNGSWTGLQSNRTGNNHEQAAIIDVNFIALSGFRLSENRTGEKLSLVDALGYSYSRKLGIKFLTGDREFSGMENVEYDK